MPSLEQVGATFVGRSLLPQRAGPRGLDRASRLAVTPFISVTKGNSGVDHSQVPPVYFWPNRVLRRR